ncbi:MAG: hypothetical protein RLZZ540_1261 [Bacteroidota bacterium]|jgi:hypothetical protein
MNKNYFAFGIPIKKVKAVCFLLVICFWISISSYSQTTKIFTSSGTLEVPAGVTSLSVQCWGAGGGGGGSNLLTAAGGGGGGGAFKSGTISVTPVPANAQYAYSVGQGGTGESTTNINGSAGGGSVFSTISANGGSGGQGGSSLVAYGPGGTGGAAGDYKGGDGASGDSVLFVGLLSGGGGSSAGTAANGNSGSGRNGGAAQTGGGAGGSGVLLLGNGSNGASLGGGGGGGAGLLSPLSATATGGNGGNGQIKVTYTCPSYSVSGVSSTSACNTFGTATVTLTSSAAGLPIGTYTVTYDRTVPSATGLTATMTVTTAGTGSFTAAGLTTVGASRITIKRLTSVDCYTDISNQYADLTVGTVPVQPGAISGYTNQCAGNTSQTYSIASVANATSYTWTVDTASGWVITAGQNSNSITVTVGTVAANISVVAVNNCGNSTASTLAISLNLPAPTASVTLQPTCAVNTGTITITAPATGTGMSYSINGVDYSNATGIFTLVPIGSYNVTAKYPSGCVSNVAVTLMQTSVVTRTWNGSWDGAAPTMEEKVVFAANYNNAGVTNENVDIVACSCQVNSGVHATIKTGHYLKLRNELIVDANGSLTFENNASLVQVNNESVNSGNIMYKRYTKAVKRYDFTYWSSPVAGEFLYNVSPLTLGDKYYSYNPSLGWQIHYNGNKEMLPGEGYIIRAPQTFSITSATIDYNPKFQGKPNNGEIKKNLAGNLVYLLGNPYPSAISADTFLTENASKLAGTLYFWTHNSPPSIAVGGDAIYNYTSNDYATYNRTGGVGTAAVTDLDTNDPNDNNNLSVPTGKIAAAQSFFAPTSATGGEIVFKNEMRLSGNVVMDNSQFFKLGTTSKSTNVVEKNRLWLNLSNAQGAFKQTLIGYITGATNEYEGSFDGVSYDGNLYVDFYSVNQGVNLSIQGRALPFQQKDSVVLGYKSAIVGEFKISIDHADGELTSQTVFLEDKLMQVLHNLKEPYTFTTEKGIFNDRFVLRYQDKTAVIEDDVPVEGVFISNNDKIITINTGDEVIKAIYVYDFSGGLIYSDISVNASAAVISDLSVGHPALIVQVILENGKKSVKKIIY